MRWGLALVVLMWAPAALPSSAFGIAERTPPSPFSPYLTEPPRLADAAGREPSATVLRLSHRTARPGTRVRVRGRGFEPRRRAIVRFAGRRLRLARTGRRGGLRTAIRVPRRAPGSYALTARTGRRVARVRFGVRARRPPARSPVSREAPRPARLGPDPAPPSPSLAPAPSPSLSGGDGGAGSGNSEPVPPGMFRNAVWDAWQFPDPTVIRVDSTYYAYGTGGTYHQVMRSTDLVHWEWLGAALPRKPDWTAAVHEWHAWAPSVLPTDEACPGADEPGCFILYYVGLSDRYGTATTNCVGVATSSRPEGPFTDRGPLEKQDGVREGGWPIGCGDGAGYGNIDPQPFVDADGRAWLYVSTDWRCTDACRQLPEISAIPLSSDRLEAAGAREPLLAAQKGSWEQAPWAPVVENPYVIKRGDTYHLLYSGGSWEGRYAMGHATGPTPTGPFTRSSAAPWTGSTDSVLSMGGGMPIRDGAGAEWLVYHGRHGSLSEPRTLRIDRMTWTADERPALDGPSTDVRIAPIP